jgi:hypothetical protein
VREVGSGLCWNARIFTEGAIGSESRTEGFFERLKVCSRALGPSPDAMPPKSTMGLIGGFDGIPKNVVPMLQSTSLELARAAAETPAPEQGTWFDMCPGRGAN